MRCIVLCIGLSVAIHAPAIGDESAKEAGSTMASIQLGLAKMKSIAMMEVGRSYCNDQRE